MPSVPSCAEPKGGTTWPPSVVPSASGYNNETNEIPMVPALLRLLDIQGCVVTTDAMSCQTATVAQIVQQGSEYVIAVKDNQPHLP